MESEIIPETQESSSDESTPPEILKKADEVINNLVPQVSRPKYEAAYNKFMKWRKNKKVKSFSEPILLTYFSDLAETKLPSTWWSTYSMLRSMIDIKHKINVYMYSGLIAFLKQQNKGFKSKKAETLDAEQINQFLLQAPDNQFLTIKVALIFGVQDACRRQELCDLTVDNIIDKGDMLLVKIQKTKTGKARTFVVTDEFYQTYKKYSSSRPTNLATKRFFVGYRNGRCTKQNIGINTFGSMPKIVAKYLNLANSESYTDHTFRRTSATLLADSGADLLTIKRHGGWKSNSVAEGYVEDSVGNKKRIGEQTARAISWRPSTSREHSDSNTPIFEKTSEGPMNISL
ncbi:uncharacterized protein LOC123271256 [Cotesia glomerata]|uniref:uncharacterized protein LOC123271256 n=1 Tax=Cotesia glomerata TaxID=32391 RepID=UPI001D02E9C7|nr:uncharacterized protein LOC123271256 [Cotesia glomerata]